MVLLVILFIIFLRGPVLNVLNVVQPDTAESLSIPLQQIGRYVKDGGTLSDSERAYYNSSYSNGSIYYVGVIENDLRIGTNVKSEALKNVIVKCDSIMQGKAITGMGLCLWILVILMSFSLMNRDYGFIENIAYVAIVLTLLIATPVGNSFRYAYPVFVGLPFVFVDAVYLIEKVVCKRLTEINEKHAK